ncbi:GNAT family N-acetyltransferase [Mucilaginibacter dorajii]|nr:GNAT family N-acetyltransferase [Mucilaginibacter dorajii]MCS3733194.1 peptidyl-dipeptidase Dcp [Mucilaginibacter dorajii]
MSAMLNVNDINIRTELQPGDLGYIAYLHGEMYARECGYGLNFESYVLQGLGDFARQYDVAKDRVWICEHNQQIVGVLIAVDRGSALQLRYFIFRPEFRGLGLGKKLMTEFINHMKKREITDAYLWTTNEQHAAITLYERYGFKLTEEKVSAEFDKELIERRYDLTLSF